MSIVISVENLGKKYLLHHQSGRQPYVALRDVLSDGIKKLGRKLTGHGSKRTAVAEKEEFWALRDVSFEVRQGERIGIIGRNGAGKSTLLKILSRITEPTTGRVRIKGRIASLLEVGTGFHPELTGRENIFLNGAIQGMNRAEIKKKFDEIVDFAEIEKFLDTPVKRYSSGMYVRLAFAVAAHLEPEILVVDEVLAVGDAQFQKKCLGKMEDVSAKEGRTVLFVSHNLEAMKLLCLRGILLDKGQRLVDKGIEETADCFEALIQHGVFSCNPSSHVIFSKGQPPDGGFDLLEVSLVGPAGSPIAFVRTFDTFMFKVTFYSPDVYESKSASIFITTFNGRVLLRLGMYPFSSFKMTWKKGINEVLCQIVKLPLPAGSYLLRFGICESQTGEWLFERDVCHFEVLSNDVYNCGNPPTERLAAVVSDYAWQLVDD